jgi:hypothetical protein
MPDCIWIHYSRPRPHWYALDAAAQAQHSRRWRTCAQTSLTAGGQRVGRFHIRGQQDFETVEIWRFPDAEAAFRHWAALTAEGYGEYNAFANNIGFAEGLAEDEAP